MLWLPNFADARHVRWSRAKLKGGAMFSSKPWNWLALCTAGILVLLVYGTANAGSLRTQAMTNTCPALTQVAVSPMKASVGGDIDVSVAATDEDGGPITYSWTGTGGSFADPTAQDTTYTCETAGKQSITVIVSDAEACMITWTAQVDCLE
jgi:hypothetical protein